MSRAFLILLLFCGCAFSQTFPAKPLRIVVPLVPGGNQDIVARAVAEEMAKGLGQQVMVENRPGASAIVGTQFVKGAAPDGYTLLSVAVTFARVPGVVKAANYDPRTDFTGVSLVCRIPQVLVVNPGHPAKNLQELIAMAKAKPGEISFGGSGNGSTGHVAAELFMRATGTRLLQVGYKGNAQALTDVMGGQIALMFDQVSTSGGHVKGGKLRARRDDDDALGGAARGADAARAGPRQLRGRDLERHRRARRHAARGARAAARRDREGARPGGVPQALRGARHRDDGERLAGRVLGLHPRRGRQVRAAGEGRRHQGRMKTVE
jgi:hypothetical protein